MPVAVPSVARSLVVAVVGLSAARRLLAGVDAGAVGPLVGAASSVAPAPTAAERRARLHPERPVRRRSTGPTRPATTPPRASTSRSRTRSTRTSSRRSAQGTLDLGLVRRHERDPGRQPGRPDQVRRDDLRQVPSIVFAKAISGITDADGLVGKKLGIPGKYGSSWIMLQALLASKRPHADRPDDRRVPGLRPGRRRRRRARSTRRPASTTTSRSSSSSAGEKSRPPDRRRHAAAGTRDHRRRRRRSPRSRTRSRASSGRRSRR